MRIIRIHVLGVLVLLLVLCTAPTPSQSALFWTGGSLTGESVTWGGDDPVVRVLDDLIVPRDTTLTVLPGTRVLVSPMKKIVVKGALIAQVSSLLSSLCSFHPDFLSIVFVVLVF